MPLSESVVTFIGCDQLLECKAMVDDPSHGLLSAEADAMCAALSEGSRDNPRLVVEIDRKREMLRRCREEGSNVAFAVMFREGYPAVPSEITLALSRTIASGQSVEQLSAEHPDWFGSLQQLYAQMHLVAALTDELRTTSESSRRVTICRTVLSLLDCNLDPSLWLQVKGELANALAAIDASSEEASTLYREILPSVRGTALEDVTLHNLGNTLGTREGSENEALSYLEQALALRSDPYQRAQTEHAIGRVLSKVKPADAVPHLRRAIELYTSGDALEAWALVIDDLAVAYLRQSEVLNAIETYEAAIWDRHAEMPQELLVSMHGALQQVCLQAARELGEEDEAERFEPPLPADWFLASSQAIPGLSLESWLPPGESIALWNEQITVFRRAYAQQMPFAGFIIAKQHDLQRRMTNAVIDFRIVSETADELTCTWSARDDFVIEDQGAVVRVLRGRDALHEIHYAFRGRNDAARDAWRERLHDARLVTRARADAPPEPPPADVERLLEELKAQMSEEPPDPDQYLRDVLARAAHVTNPLLQIDVGTLAALNLLGVRMRSKKGLDTAGHAFRRACELMPRDEYPAMWAINAVNLAYVHLMQRALDQARFGFETTMRMFIDLGDKPRVIDALLGLGHTASAGGRSDDAIAIFGNIIGALDRDRNPAQWAHTMIALGDAYATLGGDSSREADRTWSAVLEQMAANPAFASMNVDAITEILMVTFTRLQSLDRGGWEPPAPTLDPRDGRALYLRPLDSAATLTLPNRFIHPARLHVQYDHEPESLPLESILYRILGDRLVFTSIGGRPEGFGLARMYVIGGNGWQNGVTTLLPGTDIIFLMPHASPGVKWEIETIVERKAMSRCLFVMPPLSPTFDVPTMWQNAQAMMREMNLEIPPHDAEGVFFRLTNDGKVAETIPFATVWNNTLFKRIKPMIRAASA